jgi:hypothetical protein
VLGELIKDFFRHKQHPTLLRQGIQVYLADVKGVPKGKTDLECPRCGATVSIVRLHREYSHWQWLVDVICPGCTLEVKNIESNKHNL